MCYVMRTGRMCVLYHVTSGRMVNIMGCDTTLTQFPPAVSSSLHWHALITCMKQERGDLGSNLGAGTFSPPPLSTLYMDMISVSQTLIDCACYTNSTMYTYAMLLQCWRNAITCMLPTLRLRLHWYLNKAQSVYMRIRDSATNG